jgi:hypothetical protein
VLYARGKESKEGKESRPAGAPPAPADSMGREVGVGESPWGVLTVAAACPAPKLTALALFELGPEA